MTIRRSRAQHARPATHASTRATGSTGFEYRVSYRRFAWTASTSSKTRRFARREDAERFVARLQDHRRVGLSRAIWTVSHRRVGPWVGGWR